MNAALKIPVKQFLRIAVPTALLLMSLHVAAWAEIRSGEIVGITQWSKGGTDPTRDAVLTLRLDDMTGFPCVSGDDAVMTLSPDSRSMFDQMMEIALAALLHERRVRVYFNNELGCGIYAIGISQ
jgi:hypothetical protein